MKHWRNVALALALLVGSVLPAFAQFDRGSISGTIKDEQGGVMPGVTVTVTNTQTQQAQTTITNGTGFYTFPNLLPGGYDIIAELTGFSGEIRWDTSMPNGQPRRSLDASRAEKLFGFKAETPLREGLERTIAWYRASRLQHVEG